MLILLVGIYKLQKTLKIMIKRYLTNAAEAYNVMVKLTNFDKICARYGFVTHNLKIESISNHPKHLT